MWNIQEVWTNIHQGNPDYAGGVWALVPVEIGKLSGRAKRINITLPERALTELALCLRAARSGRSSRDYHGAFRGPPASPPPGHTEPGSR